MKFPDTPSLAAFKSDAAVLHRDLRSGCRSAIDRAISAQLISSGPVNRDICLRIIAKEHGLPYSKIVARDQMISATRNTVFLKGFGANHMKAYFEGRDSCCSSTRLLNVFVTKFHLCLLQISGASISADFISARCYLAEFVVSSSA